MTNTLCGRAGMRTRVPALRARITLALRLACLAYPTACNECWPLQRGPMLPQSAPSATADDAPRGPSQSRVVRTETLPPEARHAAIRLITNML